MILRFFAAILLVASICFGQRDFLTPDESDQIREVQDPNERVKLYTKFAKQRIDMVKQAIAKEKAGRSGLIHNTLEDYTEIIEAIDKVAEDALKRKVDITVGMELVAKAERDMTAVLKKILESNPKDLPRYEYVLTTAIETTNDSIELSEMDLKDRSKNVQEASAKQKKEREALMSTKELEEKKVEEKKEASTQRKAPTLRRKGETVGEEKK